MAWECAANVQALTALTRDNALKRRKSSIRQCWVRVHIHCTQNITVYPKIFKSHKSCRYASWSMTTNT